MLVSTLVLVTLAAARWHSARGHAQQAHASRQTAEYLRAAYRQAAATPMRALHDQGRALPEAVRRTHEATIRTALPQQGPQADGTPTKTDALVSHPRPGRQTGHDPEALSQRAIALRELDTAEDVHDILVWRLRRLAQLPAHPGEATPHPRAGTRQPTTLTNDSPATGRPPRRQLAPAPTRASGHRAADR
ncbi:hypothetical protein [Streptomyces angustmyceticus]|uniref:hypothetical protein n=1 Tax=Streptomyces angustmyceticus TaxID=285578 RepID=UPI003826F8A5